MPATFISREPFPNETPEERLKDEVRLRIKAGAIRCWVEENGTHKMLCTEWNVIGENDP